MIAGAGKPTLDGTEADPELSGDGPLRGTASDRCDDVTSNLTGRALSRPAFLSCPLPLMSFLAIV